MSTITPKEHPILFSGEMVRAILDGRKTVTRRVVKPQPNTIRWCPVQSNRTQGWQDEHGRPYNCPYGIEGSHLWVRERWGVAESSFKPYACTIDYLADNSSKTVHGHTGIQYAGKNLSFVWRPSKQMPRWASRIMLEITGVRVERLQEISEASAVKEGIRYPTCPIGVNHHAKEIHHVHAKGIHFMVKQEACEISFCTIFGSRWRGLVLGKRDRLYGLLQGLSFVQQGTLKQAPALVAGFKDLAVMRNAVQ